MLECLLYLGEHPPDAAGAPAAREGGHPPFLLAASLPGHDCSRLGEARNGLAASLRRRLLPGLPLGSTRWPSFEDIRSNALGIAASGMAAIAAFVTRYQRREAVRL